VAYLVVDEEILPIKPFIQNYETRDWVDEDLQVHGEFDVPADASGSLYISFANNRPTLLITIENVSSYEVRRHRADTIFNMTIGFIAGLASIVIILMTTLRNWAVLPYAAYILGATSMVTVYEGHFFHSFWRTSEQNEIFIVFLLLTLTMSGLFLFQRAFLRSQNVAPKYRVVLLVATVSAATLNFVMSFTPLAELEYITIFALILLGLLFALSPIAGAIAVAKKQRGGLPFFLGSLVFTSSVLWVLYVGFNSAKYSSQHAPPLLRYAVAFEVLCPSSNKVGHPSGLSIGGSGSFV
jgi:magnesium-transporting ATPase (P-type)